MAKFKVVISDYYYEHIDAEKREIGKLDAILEDYHCASEDEVIQVARDCDALIVQYAPITRRVVESLEKCRIIAKYAIGVDNIDLAAASERGIVVCNVPDYSLDEVSNHAAALILACARKLPLFAREVRKGSWDYTVAKPIHRFQGRVLGLAGFGRIPRLLAKKMAGFGLDIIAHDPFADAAVADELGVRLVDFDALVTESDYLSVHIPLNDQTRGLFGAAQFKRMKNTAFIVNTARGGVINEQDLTAALQNGDIAGAGLDVVEQEPIAGDNPLLAMDNVIVTPHVAWYSLEAIASLQLKAAQEVVRVLSGQPPLNPVNRPAGR